MRTIATALLVGALTLAGCGEGNSNGKSTGTDSKTQPASSTSATPAKGDSASKTDTKAKGSQDPKKKSADDFDRSTSDGTLGLFITHMQQGEFQDALMLTDPESSGYAQIEEVVNLLVEASKKPSEQGITLEAMMRAFMSRGWLGAVYQPMTVQDERARYELKLVDHDVQTMDLRKIDGDWYIVAPDWIINGVKGDISDMMPTTPPNKPANQTTAATPPSAPKPAPKPVSNPPSGDGQK